MRWVPDQIVHKAQGVYFTYFFVILPDCACNEQGGDDICEAVRLFQ